MTGFVVGAALLTIAALGFVLIPLWRERTASGRWSVSGLVMAVAVVPVAVGLYTRVTTYTTDMPDRRGLAELDMVRQLADKMVENPDDVDGWRLLGRSYLVLGEYRLARDAFIKAWDLTPAPDNELKLGLAQALIYTDPGNIQARGGDLVEEVIASEPRNELALWWGGLVAMERGDDASARSRWGTLLSLNPPPEVADLIRRQLALIPGGEAAAESAPASTGLSFELDVAIADAMPLERLTADALLFIFARAPGGGPPIAALRHPVSALPGKFSISDADAMIAGRSLDAYPELHFVARISMSGNPIEQPGDLYAEATVATDSDAPVTLLIDKVVGSE